MVVTSAQTEKGASRWKRKEAAIIASMNGVMNELILVADAFAISHKRICGNQRWETIQSQIADGSEI